jgi:hypothetical protein
MKNKNNLSSNCYRGDIIRDFSLNQITDYKIDLICEILIADFTINLENVLSNNLTNIPVFIKLRNKIIEYVDNIIYQTKIIMKNQLKSSVDKNGTQKCTKSSVDEIGTQNCTKTPVDEIGTQKCTKPPVDEIETQNCTKTPVDEIATQKCTKPPVDEIGTQNCTKTPVDEIGTQKCTKSSVDAITNNNIKKCKNKSSKTKISIKPNKSPVIQVPLEQDEKLVNICKKFSEYYHNSKLSYITLFEVRKYLEKQDHGQLNIKDNNIVVNMNKILTLIDEMLISNRISVNGRKFRAFYLMKLK